MSLRTNFAKLKKNNFKLTHFSIIINKHLRHHLLNPFPSSHSILLLQLTGCVKSSKKCTCNIINMETSFERSKDKYIYENFKKNYYCGRERATESHLLLLSASSSLDKSKTLFLFFTSLDGVVDFLLLDATVINNDNDSGKKNPHYPYLHQCWLSSWVFSLLCLENIILITFTHQNDGIKIKHNDSLSLLQQLHFIISPCCLPFIHTLWCPSFIVTVFI